MNRELKFDTVIDEMLHQVFICKKEKIDIVALEEEEYTRIINGLTSELSKELQYPTNRLIPQDTFEFHGITFTKLISPASQ
jgi:hypothetical protein